MHICGIVLCEGAERHFAPAWCVHSFKLTFPRPVFFSNIFFVFSLVSAFVAVTALLQSHRLPQPSQLPPKITTMASTDNVMEQIAALLSQLDPEQRASAQSQLSLHVKQLGRDLEELERAIEADFIKINNQSNRCLEALPGELVNMKLKDFQGEVSVNNTCKENDDTCPISWISIQTKNPSQQFDNSNSIQNSGVTTDKKGKRAINSTKASNSSVASAAKSAHFLNNTPHKENVQLNNKRKQQRPIRPHEVPHHIVAYSKNESPLLLPPNVQNQLNQIASTDKQMATPTRKAFS